MLNNLILHCGGFEVSESVLRSCPTPESTETFTPIPHIDFSRMVIDSLSESGLFPVQEIHALNRNGAHYFGLMEVTDNPDRDADSGWSTVVGLRNSHDKSMAGGLVCGHGTFVCDNLAFYGEIQVTRKHTSRLWDTLPGLIDDAVKQLRYARITMDTRIESYKGFPLTQSDSDHLIMELFRRGVINSGRLAKVDAEFRKPSHPEFAEGGLTAYTLMNACTEALKGVGLGNMPRRTIEMHALLDEHCGIKPEVSDELLVAA